MQIKNETLGVSFDLPDVFTVRMRRAYNARMLAARGIYGDITADDWQTFVWHAAFSLIANWQSEDIAASQSLDTASTAKQDHIVEFVIAKISEYVRQANEIPKN